MVRRNLGGAGDGLLVAPVDAPTEIKGRADFVCDGVRDEEELQAALDAVATLGGTVIAAAGTYTAAAGLAITANQRIVLMAHGAVLNLPANVTGLLINQGVIAARGVLVEGLKIDGQGNAGTVGVELRDTNNATLVGLQIENCVTGRLINSSAASGFVEGSYFQDCLTRNCSGTGILFQIVSGTGSFAQTIMHGERIVVGGTGTGLVVPQNAILQRSWIQGTIWIGTNQKAMFLDGNVEDTTLRIAVEGAGGSTGNTALDLGTNLTNADQLGLYLLLTGLVNTSINNPFSKALHYYPNANEETIVQTQGTVFISYKRHGDSTDRVRVEGLTAGGRVQFGNGTLLDVNLYRSAADILSSDDQLRPASLKLQTKAGTPVDGDIVGGAIDGDIVFDTTALKIWVRSGGVWKQTAALT